MNSVVLPAWEMLVQFASLKKFNFFPALIGTIWLFLILLYQTVISYVYIFQQKDAFFEWLGEIATKSYFIEILAILILLFLFHLFIEPMAKGGMIEMMHSYRQSDGAKKMRSIQGLFKGLKHYLPLLELENLIAIFKPLSVVTAYFLLLRVFGSEYTSLVSIIMGIYLVFAFLMSMLFSYAKYFVIFEQKGPIESLMASTGMAIENIGVTTRLYSTMILVYLRTIFVALIFLGFPFIVSAIITYFTIVGVQIILLVIFATVAVLLLLVITHLNSALDIFVEATWYGAYQMNKLENPTESSTHSSHDDHHAHDSGSHSAHHIALA